MTVPRAGTRGERRRAERDERRLQRRQPGPAARQTSPLVLFTGAAFVVGLLIVGFLVFQQLTATQPTNLTEPTVNIPAGLADGRTLGSSDAPVTMQVWSDFQCPACRTLAITLEPSVVQQYVVPGTVKLVYADAAYQGRNGGNPNWDESVQAAAAGRCAADQGLFWQLHDWLFANWQGENVGSFRQDRLRAIAEGAGLDMASYDSCMAAGDKQAAVRAETNQAMAAGYDHTPTLIINGTKYVGVPSYDQLVSMINGAAASPTP